MVSTAQLEIISQNPVQNIMRGCEGCRWFLKWKTDPLAGRKSSYIKRTPLGGLCDLLDGRCSTSTKFDCEHFKGKRYNRKKEKRLIDRKRRNRNWKNSRKTQYKPT